MSIIQNSENVIMVTCKYGEHKGKKFLFRESTKRFSKLRDYARCRKDEYRDSLYLGVIGIKRDGSWNFSTYGNEPSTLNLPMPHLILDIKNNKIYQIEAQLWELPTHTL